MNWVDAEVAWSTFLNEVERARRTCHCTWSNAWFRGHDDTGYALRPSLMRRRWLDIPAAERPMNTSVGIDGRFKKVALKRRQVRHELRDLRLDPTKNSLLATTRKRYRNLEREEKK